MNGSGWFLEKALLPWKTGCVAAVKPLPPADTHCKRLKHDERDALTCISGPTPRSGAEPAWHKRLTHAFVALSSTGRETNRGAGLLYLYSLLVSVGYSPRLPWCHLQNPETMRRRISIFHFFSLSLSLFPLQFVAEALRWTETPRHLHNGAINCDPVRADWEWTLNTALQAKSATNKNVLIEHISK